jgi:hypothetical protein
MVDTSAIEAGNRAAPRRLGFEPGDTVDVRQIDDESWKTLRGLLYQGKVDDFPVPPGEPTDFASVPRIFVAGPAITVPDRDGQHHIPVARTTGQPANAHRHSTHLLSRSLDHQGHRSATTRLAIHGTTPRMPDRCRSRSRRRHTKRDKLLTPPSVGRGPRGNETSPGIATAEAPDERHQQRSADSSNFTSGHTAPA